MLNKAINGKILTVTDGGELIIADASPAGYKQLAKAKVLNKPCWTMPVLANGKIYCRSQPGDLVCLDVKGP